MLAMLILGTFFAIKVLFFGNGNDIKEAAVKAFLVLFALIVIFSEGLSLFGAITFRWLRIVWSGALLISVIFFFRNWKKIWNRIEVQFSTITLQWKNWKHRKKASLFLAVLGWGGIVFILSVTLMIAYLAPPNNFDSMTYHMSRVVHWIQNQSIKFYPTAIPRQNYSLPLAEYAILHLQILTKTDKLANLVQWSSFLMSIVLMMKIADIIGLNKRGQLITGVLVAGIPMAILQSSSTQNDLVVGFFCLAFAFFMLKVVKTGTWEDVLFASLALGFALLTKGTGYIFCAGIGLGIAGVYLIGLDWSEIKKKLIQFSVIVLSALVISTGHFTRNIQLYNHPLSTENSRITADSYSTKSMFSNLVRNGAVHLATPIPAGNELLNKAVLNLLGDQINNPDSTFGGTEFQVSFSLNEDSSGNLLHFVFLAAAASGLIFRRKRISKEETAIWISMLLGVILFNLLLKWQPWGTRLQAPLFMLGSVLIGSFIAEIAGKSWLNIIVVGILLIFSLPYLLLNTTRPVLPLFTSDSLVSQNRVVMYLGNKIDKFFLKHPGLSENLKPVRSLFYDGRSILYTKRKRLYFLSNFSYFYDYAEAKNEIEKYPVSEIGLLMDSNDWEYPIWALLGRNAAQGLPEIKHIMVKDVSRKYDTAGNELPPLIVATAKDSDGVLSGQEFSIVYEADSIQVLVDPELLK